MKKPANLVPAKQLKESDYVEVPTNREIKRNIVEGRKLVADLPAPPQQMNTIAVVAAYNLFGLSNEAISDATGLQLSQVEHIVNMEVFKDSVSEMCKQVIQQDEDIVRNMFKDSSKKAAKKIIKLAEQEIDPILAFKASQDVLDRGGHSAKAIVEHQHKMQGELVIRYVDDNMGDHVPTINMEELPNANPN